MSNKASKWSSNNVRRLFIDYFVEQRAHQYVPSSPVVPFNDPSLLFANAGMNQFKPLFTGEIDAKSPMKSIKRAVNSQKCIRAGGKHNDLDDVGKDSYHHTFFEMLGTWSFGDYYKKDCINWAFDLLVNKYKLPKEHLYVSYFQGDERLGLPCDEEARQLWSQLLPDDRILPFGAKANFWEMGDTGPCGPCSEIHFDRLGGLKDPSGRPRYAGSMVNNDDPDVLEIWNLVFMQYYREKDSSLTSLPLKNIDTGMGLERLVSVLQEKRSNYDTDIFIPIFQSMYEEIKGHNKIIKPYSFKYGKEDAAQGYRDTAYRVIADHARACAFALADGAVPSSEGRGYVIRRIIRRALRFSVDCMGMSAGFFSQIVSFVCTHMGDVYPELLLNKDHIVALVREEEVSFHKVLTNGTMEFRRMVQQLPSGSILFPGSNAFQLHDSLGLPVDITQLLAEEKGLKVDMNGFEHEMQLQKARSGGSGKMTNSNSPSESLLSLCATQPCIQLVGSPVLTVHDIENLRNSGISATFDDDKYNEKLTCDAKLLRFVAPDKGLVPLLDKNDVQYVWTTNGERISVKNIGILFDKTCFYAESGGQIGDSGSVVLHTDKEIGYFHVRDVQFNGSYVVHIGDLDIYLSTNELTTCNYEQLLQSLMSMNIAGQMNVFDKSRRETATHHTVTHMLNFAINRILADLGSEQIRLIDQRGSHVNDERMRFDFAYHKQPAKEDLQKIENLVNLAISSDIGVSVEVLPLADAFERNKSIDRSNNDSKIGLRAIFGENYPDPVRVVSICGALAGSNYKMHSIELCGGTHLPNTKEAVAFKILDESAVSKGIRRITAVAGEKAVNVINADSDLLSQTTNLLLKCKSLKDSNDVNAVNATIGQLRSDLKPEGKTQYGYFAKNSARQQLDECAKLVTQFEDNAQLQHVKLLLTQAVQTTNFSSFSDKIQYSIVNDFVIFSCQDPLANSSKGIKSIVQQISKMEIVKSSRGFVLLACDPMSGMGQISIVASITSNLDAKSQDALTLVQKSLDNASKLKASKCVGGGSAKYSQGTLEAADKETMVSSLGDFLVRMLK